MGSGGYRPGSGPRKGAKYRKKGDAAAPKPKARKKAGIPEDIIAEATAENMTPLAYMLKVMMDGDADPARRDRMAVSAAPFIHPKAGESGKKEGKDEKAAVASRGKFRAGRAPLALVQ